GHAHPFAAAMQGTHCAQRLSASQTWSRGRGQRPAHLPDVLNASRRHRLGHASMAATKAADVLCSTPLGVTDLVTSASWCRRSTTSSAQRLSASQTWSPELREISSRIIKCSTPLGVTDLVTHRWVSPHHRVEGAQRLSASQTWSHGPARRAATLCRVL